MQGIELNLKLIVSVISFLITLLMFLYVIVGIRKAQLSNAFICLLSLLSLHSLGKTFELLATNYQLDPITSTLKHLNFERVLWVLSCF
jgi:hypothetical protein